MIKNQIPDFILVRFTPLRPDLTVKIYEEQLRVTDPDPSAPSLDLSLVRSRTTRGSLCSLIFQTRRLSPRAVQ